MRHRKFKVSSAGVTDRLWKMDGERQDNPISQSQNNPWKKPTLKKQRCVQIDPCLPQLIMYQFIIDATSRWLYQEKKITQKN